MKTLNSRAVISDVAGGKPRNLPVLATASAEVKERTVLYRTVSDFNLSTGFL